jgi:protein-tyrosine phosphatase
MSGQRWDEGAVGVLRLPSGRLVRGRGLRGSRGLAAVGGAEPEYGLYLLGRRPAEMGWEAEWLRWPDFWLPTDRQAAADAIRAVLERAGRQRVEVACGGGRGRTGTALACLAALDGLSGDAAVAYVRERYDRRAVETLWQRGFVRRFAAEA